MLLEQTPSNKQIRITTPRIFLKEALKMHVLWIAKEKQEVNGPWRSTYMEMIEISFKALAKPKASVTADAYNIWWTQNPTKRPNMDANKLANTRRDNMNKKRLTDMEIQAIKDKVTDKTDCTEKNSPHEINPSAETVEDNAPVASD